jgi:hypothetical protein
VSTIIVSANTRTYLPAKSVTSFAIAKYALLLAGTDAGVRLLGIGNRIETLNVHHIASDRFGCVWRNYART